MPKAPHHTLEKAIDTSIAVKENLTVGDFVPHPHHLVVEPLPPDTMVGSLIIPETHRKKQAMGWVRAIAPVDEGGLYEVGDLVLFANSAGQAVSFDGREHVVLQYHTQEESEIIGRWPKKLFDTEGA